MTEWPDTSRSYWILLKQSWWVNFFHSPSNEKHKRSRLNLRLFHIFLNNINSLLQAKGNDSIFIPLFGILLFLSLAFCFLGCKCWQSLQSFTCNTQLCTGTTLTGWGDTIHTWGTCRCPTCQVSQGDSPSGLPQPSGQPCLGSAVLPQPRTALQKALAGGSRCGWEGS